MPKISVIICAYNAAQTIERAAESVLSQGFRDIELIIVNDGSSDSTLAKVAELSMRDRRVKAINVSNGGVSKARNISLLAANGDYITFCDADDYMDDGALAAMYDRAVETGSDMVITGYFHETVLGNGSISRVAVSADDAVYSTKEQLLADFIDLKSKYLVDAMCNKLFKRSVIADNGMKFLEGELFEDTAFSLDFFGKTQKIAVLDKCFYHYIQYPNKGITRQYNPKKLQTLTERYHKLLEFCMGGSDSVIGFCHLYNVRNTYSCLSGTYGTTMMRAERKNLVKSTIQNEQFRSCVKKVTAKGFANKVTLLVAKSNCLLVNRLYCYAIYFAKNKAVVLFTKFKR